MPKPRFVSIENDAFLFRAGAVTVTGTVENDEIDVVLARINPVGPAPEGPFPIVLHSNAEDGLEQLVQQVYDADYLI